MMTIPQNKQLILFDGVCNLCNAAIQFVIAHDKHNRFMFAALQSETGKAIAEQYDVDTEVLDSIVLYIPNKGVYSKSTAALKIASKLGFPINLLRIFIIVPPFIRHWVYSIVAKNRYRWFGKKEACMVPTPVLKEKFMG